MFLLGAADGVALRVVSPPSSGLKLWLKADAGITLASGNVQTWADQSGNGNDVTQATSGSRPAFNATSVNGLPGVTFASGKQLANTVNVVPTSSDRSIIVVAKTSSAGGGGMLVGFRSTTICWNAQLTFDSVTAAFVYGSGAPQGPALINWTFDSLPHVFEEYGTLGSLVTIAMDGANKTVSPVTETGVVVAETGTAGTLIGGSAGTGAQSWTGDICEVLVYDHILSEGDQKTLRQYLQARYGISLGL